MGRKAVRPAAVAEADEYGDVVEGDAPPARKGPPRLAIIGGVAGGVAVVVLGLLLVVWSQMKAAADAKRKMASDILTTIALKWELEGESVRECEEAWKMLRSPENQKFLDKFPADAEGREKSLRMWVYVKQREGKPTILKADGLVQFFDSTTDQALNKGAVMKSADGFEKPIYDQDLTLDWLAVRGYRILENLKKAGANPNPSLGAKLENQGGGSVRVNIFGSALTAEYDPAQSTIDIEGKAATVAFTSNYPVLLGTSSAPQTLFVTARVVDVPPPSRWKFDFTKEVEEHLATSGTWACRAFEAK
jgi:hypothetical protein